MSRPKDSKLTEEHKQKLSESHKGKVRSQADKNKISKGKLKYVFTPEHLENIRLSNDKNFDMVCRECGGHYTGRKNSRYCPDCKGDKHSYLREMNYEK